MKQNSKIVFNYDIIQSFQNDINFNVLKSKFENKYNQNHQDSPTYIYFNSPYNSKNNLNYNN